MPECKKCNTHFESRFKIGGKLFYLRNRVHCFECQPFKNRNCKNTDGMLTVCTLCNREYNYNRKAGHTTINCNSCLTNKRKHSNKLKAIEYKGGKCQRCGYNKSVKALSFHHLKPSEKLFNISGSHGRKWENIQQELDKCILLCLNCHAETEEELAAL